MSEILERAMKQYREKVANSELLHIEVPEWPDEQGKPTIIYFKPGGTLPVREYSKLLEMVRQGTVESAVDIIILRALNEDKVKMFKPVHRTEMLLKTDPEILLEIIKRMGDVERDYKVNLEEVEKN